MTRVEILRAIPAMSQLLEDAMIQPLLESHPRHLVVEALQEHLARLRKRIQNHQVEPGDLQEFLRRLPDEVAEELNRRMAPSLRPLVNATGVLIHTNAGRAPLSPATAQAMVELAQGYSNLEYDLNQRRRGHRDRHFEPRAVRVLGCEAATVCNNNAAALVLILNTLAQGRKVLVSRGELVEIGGSFRIPDILETSGAVLREVGATNKTHLEDYRRAIDEQTAMILKVHSSNFKIVGFTAQVETSQLAHLAKSHGLPLVEDIGSGLLFDSQHPALRREPSVQRTLSQGADLVCFSGDKLLGGPQAGLILGREALISRIRSNPLMRAMRVDKCTYAGLSQVLTEYEKGTYLETIPIHRMLNTTREELRQRLLGLQGELEGSPLQTSVVEGASLTGGGSAPEEQIPTWLLSVTHPQLTANQIEARLRLSQPPVLVRIEDDRILIDLRSVFPQQDKHVVQALLRATQV